jgi:hypothetical protein
MIAGLILAAGESSRMGQDKALLTYRGRTFLGIIIQTLPVFAYFLSLHFRPPLLFQLSFPEVPGGFPAGEKLE